MRFASLWSIVLVAGLGASLIVAAPGLAAFPGNPGRIAFDSETAGRTVLIYDYDPRTKKRRALTHRPASCPKAWWNDGGAEYSPNGKLIAYLHGDYCDGGDAHNSLWIMRADGSGRRKLSQLQGVEVFSGQIAFSPDGRRIAVLSAASPTGPATQLLLDAKTGAVVHSYQWPPRSFGDSPDLDWGTNGTIAIGWTRHGSLWAVPPRGGSFERLTFPRRPGPWGGLDTAPTFSPSGRTVAFARSEERRGYDEPAPMRYGIWRTSTRKPHRAERLVVSRRWELSSPVFSPDGRQIAFFDPYGIRVVPSSGGRPSRRLLRSRGLGSGTSLDWQPLPRRPDRG
jgi:Tol biopolymer transport system component